MLGVLSSIRHRHHLKILVFALVFGRCGEMLQKSPKPIRESFAPYKGGPMVGACSAHGRRHGADGLIPEGKPCGLWPAARSRPVAGFSTIHFHPPFPSFPYMSLTGTDSAPLHAPSTFHPASMKFPSMFQTFAIHFQSPFPSCPVDSTPCIDCIIRSNVRHGCSIVAPYCNPFSIHSINAF